MMLMKGRNHKANAKNMINMILVREYPKRSLSRLNMNTLFIIEKDHRRYNNAY